MKKELVTILLLTVFTFSCQPIKKEKQLPDIIWLMTEDISLDLACYAMKAVKTPILDQMLNGVEFGFQKLSKK